MPKASPIQPSFSGGEFSPRVYGRVDNERYKTGLALSLNYLPTIQGPLVRRPGSKYSGSDAKDPSKPPEFIPFQFSQTQNYVLEFGDKYIRFFTNGAQITANTTVWAGSFYSSDFGSSMPTYALRSTSTPNPGETSNTIASSVTGVIELQSPYAYPDVSNLKYTQKDDTLFLHCSTYPTYKLIRKGNVNWDLVRVNYQDGPYLPLNSYLSAGDAIKYPLILGAPVILPTLPNNGPTIYSATTGPTYSISSVANNGAGLIRVTTGANHLFVTGDRIVIRGASGPQNINNGTSSVSALSWPVIKISDTVVDLVGSVYGSGVVTGGTVYPAIFGSVSTASVIFRDTGRSVAVYGSNGNRIWGRITDVQDPSRVTIALDRTQAAFANSGFWATYWNLGAYFVNSYPSCGTLHQDRLALAGMPFYPQRVDLSVSSDYENFAPSNSSLVVADDNAVSFNLNSDQINKIQWLKSDTQGLLAGSFSAEWNITPNNQAAALTATNVNAKQTSFFGSHDADAVQTGNATLYVQRGQRRVREMNYFFQVDTYRSTDIMELAEHLSGTGIAKLVNQRETIPIVWARTEEGKLRSMTYSRDDATLKVGWAPHKLGGQSDSSGTAPVIKTMAVIPSSDGTFDQLWMGVQRFINGTSVVNIEYLNKVFDDETNLEDAKLLDCSGTYDSPITISGISQAGSAIVTASAHGLVDGDQVKVTKVIGLNSSFTDVSGYVVNSNLVNGQLFRVGSSSTNAFFLQDINNGSSYIDSRTYTPYFSGGEVRKLVQSISGLTWLKNETVKVLADGKVHPETTVNSAGVLALQYKAAVVQVGYGYNSDGMTLRAEAGAGDGTSIGKIRRVHRAAFMVHNVGEMQVGPGSSRLVPLTFDNFSQPQADQPQPLFSGIVRESLESEHDFQGQVFFRQSDPLPGMIQAITLIMEENDV